MKTLLLIGLFCFAVSANAASVVKVKGKNVLISASQGEVTKGQIYYALDPQGKRKGAVKIVKIKGKKALAKLIKGTAQKSWKLLSLASTQPKTPPKRETAGTVSTRAGSKSSTDDGGFSLGFLGGTSINSMTVNIANAQGGTTQANLSGSSIQAKIIADYNPWQNFGFRASLGMDQFSAEGQVTDNSCSSSNTCVTDISYIGTSLLGRGLWKFGAFTLWLGGGLSVLLPGSQESTSLDEESIGTTLGFLGALGTDIKIGKSFSMPIQASYTLISPGSSEVSSSSIAIQTGLSYHF